MDVELDGCRLLRGDCLGRLAEVEDGSVSAVLCDLPYGTTACPWDVVIPFAPLWAHYLRVLKPRGVAVLSACQPFTTDLINSNRKWFRYELVWDKVVSTGFLDANRRPLRGHENILVFARGLTTYHPQFEQGKPYRQFRRGHKCATIGDKKVLAVSYETVSDGRRFPRTIVRFAREGPGRNGKHPTQKPVDLFRWLVRTYTDPGDLVLDNTMGSGTTGVAAIAEGRRFVGIERDPDYFATAEARIREASARSSTEDSSSRSMAT
ncbi:MAG: phage methylase [Planctomycetota bacterium]|nr:phage methylase [Planctomycetota bacterium]